MKHTAALLAFFLSSSPMAGFTDPTTVIKDNPPQTTEANTDETSTPSANGIIVNGDGSLLILDNTHYEVHPDDRQTSSGWIDSPGPFRVTHLDNNPDYPFEIKNLNPANEKEPPVRAKKIDPQQ
jgi:hypothetical protein